MLCPSISRPPSGSPSPSWLPLLSLPGGNAEAWEGLQRGNPFARELCLLRGSSPPPAKGIGLGGRALGDRRGNCRRDNLHAKEISAPTRREGGKNIQEGPSPLFRRVKGKKGRDPFNFL